RWGTFPSATATPSCCATTRVGRSKIRTHRCARSAATSAWIHAPSATGCIASTRRSASGEENSMMNEDTREERLDDVLGAFLLSGGDAANLKSWIQRYPEFAEELTDFVAARTLMNSLPAAPDAIPEAELTMRTQTVLERVLANVSAEPQAAAIQSLLAAA